MNDPKALEILSKSIHAFQITADFYQMEMLKISKTVDDEKLIAAYEYFHLSRQLLFAYQSLNEDIPFDTAASMPVG